MTRPLFATYPARRGLKPRLLQALFGPASIIDGIVETLTLGRVSPYLRLRISGVLMRAECEHLRRRARR